MNTANYSKKIQKNQGNIKRFPFRRINDGNSDFQPETSDQFVMRGVAMFYAREIENSITDFNEVISPNSKNHYAFKVRAFSLKYLNLIDEAISDLKKAIVKFNNDFELWPEYEDAIVNKQHTLDIFNPTHSLLNPKSSSN